MIPDRLSGRTDGPPVIFSTDWTAYEANGHDTESQALEPEGQQADYPREGSQIVQRYSVGPDPAIRYLGGDYRQPADNDDVRPGFRDEWRGDRRDVLREGPYAKRPVLATRCPLAPCGDRRAPACHSETAAQPVVEENRRLQDPEPGQGPGALRRGPRRGGKSWGAMPARCTATTGRTARRRRRPNTSPRCFRMERGGRGLWPPHSTTATPS